MSSGRCRRKHFTVDIRCVTKWSKLETSWGGVSLDTLLDGVQTDAEYVTACSDGGYTTNLPLEDLLGRQALGGLLLPAGRLAGRPREAEADRRWTERRQGGSAGSWTGGERRVDHAWRPCQPLRRAGPAAMTATAQLVGNWASVAAGTGTR